MLLCSLFASKIDKNTYIHHISKSKLVPHSNTFRSTPNPKIFIAYSPIKINTTRIPFWKITTLHMASVLLYFLGGSEPMSTYTDIIKEELKLRG